MWILFALPLFEELGALFLVVDSPTHEGSRIDSKFGQTLGNLKVGARMDLCTMSHVFTKHELHNGHYNRHDGGTWPPTHVHGAHGHWNSFHEHFNGRFQKDSIKVLVQIKALNRIDTVSWN